MREIFFAYLSGYWDHIRITSQSPTPELFKHITFKAHCDLFKLGYPAEIDRNKWMREYCDIRSGKI